MARQSQSTDGWPTILWIAWRAGKTEHREPLCRDHREHVFENYPASAHGQRRRGDECSMCSSVPKGTAFGRPWRAPAFPDLAPLRGRADGRRARCSTDQGSPPKRFATLPSLRDAKAVNLGATEGPR